MQVEEQNLTLCFATPIWRFEFSVRGRQRKRKNIAGRDVQRVPVLLAELQLMVATGGTQPVNQLRHQQRKTCQQRQIRLRRSKPQIDKASCLIQ